jgi:cleavage and polyadenylation specificity factor subunit 3
MTKRGGISFTVLGGGGEVGANCFLLGVDGHQILLDCGTHPKKEGREALPDFSLLKSAPDALVVSHAHVDHCGAVPHLMRLFPTVRCYTTLPTARIMDRMLHNSVAVMGTIAKERGVRDYPLYEHKDVNFAMRGVIGQDFGASVLVPLDPPVEITFHYSGHVVGSASVLIRSTDHTLFYSGDVCENAQELMGGCRPLSDEIRVDTLIIESTHGATDESGVMPYPQEIMRLGESVAKVLNGGGSVLVPSFALGRTQEMLNILARLQEEGIIPQVPIYASGLGRAIYELYDKFSDQLKPGATIRPLSQFGRIGNVWQEDEVKRLIESPCIIVATSGMMLENTPSAMIAQEMVQHAKHGIFFVGYLDPDTLGYKLLGAEVGDKLSFGTGRLPVELRLQEIERFHFSAHASREALQAAIHKMAPKNLIFVHGDPDAIDWMRDAAGNGYQTYSPTLGQTMYIKG